MNMDFEPLPTWMVQGYVLSLGLACHSHYHLREAIALPSLVGIDLSGDEASEYLLSVCSYVFFRP